MNIKIKWYVALPLAILAGLFYWFIFIPNPPGDGWDSIGFLIIGTIAALAIVGGLLAAGISDLITSNKKTNTPS